MAITSGTGAKDAQVEPLLRDAYALICEEELHSQKALQLNAMIAARPEELHLRSAVSEQDHSQSPPKDYECHCSGPK